MFPFSFRASSSTQENLRVVPISASEYDASSEKASVRGYVQNIVDDIHSCPKNISRAFSQQGGRGQGRPDMAGWW